ncbi:hypothetical protein vseg_019158 [Gypsophila vaccaria]
MCNTLKATLDICRWRSQLVGMPTSLLKLQSSACDLQFAEHGSIREIQPRASTSYQPGSALTLHETECGKYVRLLSFSFSSRVCKSLLLYLLGMVSAWCLSL